MKLTSAHLPFAVALLTASAQAQVPVYFQLPPGSEPTDVSTYNGNVVVVGTAGGTTFRWTPAGGLVTIGLSTPSQGTAKISTDGSTIVGDFKPGAISQTAIWAGGTSWNAIPAIPGGNGNSELGGVNVDGTVIAGLSYSSGGTAHSYRWTASNNTTVDLQFFNSPQSRAWDVSDDGLLVVGWQGGSQNGARWKTPFTAPTFGLSFFMNGASQTAPCYATNANGTIAVGQSLNPTTAAWRWDSGPNANTLLPNLPADPNRAVALDLTDDGSQIVGFNGDNFLGTIKSIIWVSGVPQPLETYLAGQGMVGGLSQLGIPTAISSNGDAIVGHQLTLAGPDIGWVVLSSDLLTIGTPYCFGDGTGTACPCAHVGSVSSGCPNNASAAGGKLQAVGDASIAVDTLKLKARQVLPFGPGLYFQGSAQILAGNTFGNGLLCVGGMTPRLEIRFADALGESETTVPIHILGSTAAGDTRYYQLWYRDDPSYCPNTGFNLTNAVALIWNP